MDIVIALGKLTSGFLSSSVTKLSAFLDSTNYKICSKCQVELTISVFFSFDLCIRYIILSSE